MSKAAQPAQLRTTAPWLPGRLLQSVPPLVALLLAGPVLAGLAGVVLPAFGYLPDLGGTGLSLQPLRVLLDQPGLATSAALSLAGGLVTAAVALLGVLGLLAATAGTRKLALLQQGLAPLLAVPHAAAAVGLAVLLAPSGMLMRLAALPLGFDRPPDYLFPHDPFGLALMAGLIAKEMPFLLLVAIAALPQAEPERRLRLARSLGYGRIAGFTLAVWPSVYRQIRLPVFAVIAYGTAVVDVAAILGPSAPATLAVRITGWMNDPDLSRRFIAAAGALLQLGVTAVALIVWRGIEVLAGGLSLHLAAAGTRLPHDRSLRRLVILPALIAAAALIAGLFAVMLWSFAAVWRFPDLLPDRLTLATWTRTLPAALRPLGTSLAVGAASSTVALVLVIANLEALRRRHLASLEGSDVPAYLTVALALPLIVPQIAFLFGLETGFLALGLSPSLPLLISVHLVFVIPYVALALADPWFALDPRYEQIAASLGRRPLAVLLRLRLPMLLGPLATALAVGFAVSVGQYLPSLIVGAGRLPTITTEAVALASGGDRRIIGVYAVLQAALPLLAFALAASLPALRHAGRRGMRA
ncbi:ABC transporter permease [Mangrovicella endophytica]|uniref:ABC transporter permease n=1 Tax=Mangrovicella endophytica TaxID=2066697 RepID=UPI00315AED41